MSWEGASSLGLRQQAREFVEGLRRQEVQEVIGTDVGGYPCVQYALNRYIAQDKVYTEYEQAYEHICVNGGDHGHYFIALKDESGNEIPQSLWTKEEIERGCLNEAEYQAHQRYLKKMHSHLQEIGVKIIKI